MSASSNEWRRCWMNACVHLSHFPAPHRVTETCWLDARISHSVVIKSRCAAQWSEAGRMAVCWDRCTLCLHDLTAAVTHSHVVIVLCSNTEGDSDLFWVLYEQMPETTQLQNRLHNVSEKLNLKYDPGKYLTEDNHMTTTLTQLLYEYNSDILLKNNKKGYRYVQYSVVPIIGMLYW